MNQLLKKFIHNERGVATFEFLGMVPFFLMTAIIVWQAGLFGHTLIVAASAAREGARAMAVEEDCYAAADNASYNWDGGSKQIVCYQSGDKAVAKVTLQVKDAVIPMIGEFEWNWITQTASMRVEPKP